ncbi:MAG: hypothetical protein BGP24_00940 [Lysobacterales bacterium 69-70]|nr:hypothetical protein [Xanthomonadaceae bacterium]ODU36132.1 MAG: hypothetical protein ABS97_02030 [Xanthomonadaceae bacterium SCN 69-320]ODV18124.1 MAG: hypothetical protein ABT27_14405 [Xanthomonadaceae bacterium SCN 69-25]OJY99409.1 MAG: hypothetical protein BGP24_00940 [Xanthomonadales bacterium 69-70]
MLLRRIALTVLLSSLLPLADAGAGIAANTGENPPAANTDGTAAPERGAYRFVDVSRQQSFEEQVTALHAEMKPGGRFEFLKSKDRREIDRQFAAITKVLERRLDRKLDDEDLLEVYSAQETVNAILTQNDGRRMVCERSAPIGSNRKELQCATAADRERAHKETRRMMRENLDKGQLTLDR